MRRLEPKQYQVYQYVASYIERKGYSPLVAEIATALRIDVPTVEHTLWCLRDWGYVTYLSPHSQMLYLTKHIPQVATEDKKAAPPKRKRRARTALMNKNRQRIYAFIGEYVAKNDYPPALRDIATQLGIGVTTVRHHVHCLRDQGYLTVLPGRSRSIRLTDKRFIATEIEPSVAVGD
ncbi:MAG: hypothetical protein AAFR67_00020 [Chloroflexota bacterium]